MFEVKGGGRRWGRVLGLAIVLALTAVTASPVQSFAAARGEAMAAKAQPRGSVYLFLGLLNVFSTGLDTLSGELQAKGVPNTVMNYGGWMGAAARVEARYAKDRLRTRPIVLIGHSFGADAAISMSAALARKNIPVDLVVLFDATARQPVPANVRHLINFYSASDGIGKILRPAAGFHGRIDNVNIDKLHEDIGHLNIEKQESLHKRVIRAVLALYGRGARVSSK